MEKVGVYRQDILDFALKTYDVVAEYPWFDSPEHAVLRHPNGKWFGVIMNIGKSKLGLDKNEKVDILVCKCHPMLRDILLEQKGFLPAYHMNKVHWVTILLDGSAERSLALHILEESYKAIERQNKKGATNDF